jgi:hypothetical protein
MDKRSSLGVLRSEQTRLRGFGGTAGAVGFGSFPGDSFPVQRRIGEQVKSQWREKNSCWGMGRRRLPRFMVGAPLRLIRRVEGGIFLARVNPSAGAKLAARMLPNLPPPVPMKAKLRQLRGHVARLLFLKLNPNPLAHYLAQFPKARSLMVEQVNNLRCGKSPVLKSESEINPMQWFSIGGF